MEKQRGEKRHALTYWQFFSLNLLCVCFNHCLPYVFANTMRNPCECFSSHSKFDIYAICTIVAPCKIYNDICAFEIYKELVSNILIQLACRENNAEGMFWMVSGKKSENVYQMEGMKEKVAWLAHTISSDTMHIFC